MTQGLKWVALNDTGQILNINKNDPNYDSIRRSIVQATHVQAENIVEDMKRVLGRRHWYPAWALTKQGYRLVFQLRYQERKFVYVGISRSGAWLLRRNVVDKQLEDSPTEVDN